MSVTISDAAFNKVETLLAEVADEDIAALRIAVQGGGCSGFTYVFQWATEVEESDEVQESANGVKIVVDPMSMMYLDGAEVDYVSSLQGEQFSIRNPNATTTCGCGSSFS